MKLRRHSSQPKTDKAASKYAAALSTGIGATGSKTADQLIDRALTLLSAAQPSAGLENRILSAMKERVQPHVIAPVRPVRSMFAAWLTCGAALAAVMLALFSFGHILPHPTPAGPATTAAERAVPPKSSHPMGGAMEASSAASLRSRGVAARGTTPAPRMAERSPQAVASAQRTPLDTLDELALAELHAPSRPAPPEPLTAQERLLLGLAHRPDMVEIAALNPSLRAELEARDAADFKRFFTPPPEPPQPSVDSSSPGSTATPAEAALALKPSQSSTEANPYPSPAPGDQHEE